MPLHFKTPTYPSRALSQASGRDIHVKFDSLQPSGSFKIRGIGFACETYAARGARRLVSSSGGNAGIAVAYAGAKLGLPVTVYVPETASPQARRTIAGLGAELIVHGAAWIEANALAQASLTPADAFIHPFDDPLLWQGHATLVDEIVADGLKPDAIVLSVGGGGLFVGVVEGLQRHGLSVPVVAVETEGAASLAGAVAAGERIVLPAIRTIASSLAAPQVCARAFELAMTHPVRCATVSDQQAVAACLRFLGDHRMLVEPACGASLAAIYDGVPELGDARDIVVIACGGTTATHGQLAAWDAALAA